MPRFAISNRSGLDIVPDVNKLGELTAPETISWLVGGQFNLSKKFILTADYSQVNVWDKGQESYPVQYKYSRYAVGNLFYNISPAFTVGLEYLYGTRTNNNNASGHSQPYTRRWCNSISRTLHGDINDGCFFRGRFLLARHRIA